MATLPTLPSNDGSVSFTIWNWLKRLQLKVASMDTSLTSLLGAASVTPPSYTNYLGEKNFGWWCMLNNGEEMWGVRNTVSNLVSPGGTTGGTQSNTSIFTQQKRLDIATIAVLNDACGQYFNNLYIYRGDATGKGGFLIGGQFGFNSFKTTARFGVGLYPTSAVPSGNNDPSSYNNSIFFGIDSADTNIQFMVRDNAGTSNKTDLGSNFPRPTSAQDWYHFVIYAAPNGSSVTYWLKNMYNTNTTSGTVSSNLPLNTTQLYFTRFANNGNNNTTTVTMSLGNLYFELPY